MLSIRRLRINMSSYGGPTKKATHLYSSLSAECNVIIESIEHVFTSWCFGDTTWALKGFCRGLFGRCPPKPVFLSPENGLFKCVNGAFVYTPFLGPFCWTYLNSWGYQFLGIGIGVHNQHGTVLFWIHAGPNLRPSMHWWYLGSSGARESRTPRDDSAVYKRKRRKPSLRGAASQAEPIISRSAPFLETKVFVKVFFHHKNPFNVWNWLFQKSQKYHLTFPIHGSRFGRALAKTRTQYSKRNHRFAVKFLRAARKTTNDFDRRQRVNAMWTKQADLQPIIEFLSTSHRGWGVYSLVVFSCNYMSF